uniref:ENTH domain-containing protein n=1 Tax=Arundo donax TaxID=35708 RepID=A0A0A8ZNZ1_ARUDO
MLHLHRRIKAMLHGTKNWVQYFITINYLIRPMKEGKA